MRKGLLPILGLMAALASTTFGHPFKAGEVLDYEVRYLKYMRGTARMAVVAETTYQGVPALHMTQDIRVGSFFSNHIEILCRNDDLLPLLITTRIQREGGLALGRQVYDPVRKRATFSQTQGGRTKTKTVEREHPLQDILTVMYYLRSQPLAEGAFFPISLWEGEYTLRITGKEEMETNIWQASPCSCWVVVSDPPKIRAWLTPDEKRYPVRVETEGKGESKMTLRNASDASP
jgi:hypothetical protein